MKNAIIIMVKVPEAGKVKTRLQPQLSPQQSAEFAACLLRDTINNAADCGKQIIIAYSPFEGRAFFDDFLQHDLILTPQIGADLGERMFNAFEFAFGQKIDSAVMIGTDSPTLPDGLIGKSLENFLSNDGVLGPTEDGGFYLIGLKRNNRKLFENVEWSSEKTFEQTAQNFEQLGLRLAILEKWYDVDDFEDLERMRSELHNDPTLAPETAKWVKEFTDDKLRQ